MRSRPMILARTDVPNFDLTKVGQRPLRAKAAANKTKRLPNNNVTNRWTIVGTKQTNAGKKPTKVGKQ